MIILVADDNALSRELIRELLEGSGQVAEKFGFQQIFWYRPHSLAYTLSALQLLE
jgi:CheY-like chemotaxis protein